MTFISSLTYTGFFGNGAALRAFSSLAAKIGGSLLGRMFRFAARLSGKDAEIVDKTGLETLFMSILRHYDPIIRRIAFSYSNTREEFDDLRQDILLNIWRGLPGFRNESKPSTWIWRVALNTCVSTVRSRLRSVDTSGDDSLLRAVAVDTETENHLELLERLHDAISRLSADDKAIITLRLEEKSYEEIAEVMGMNRNTIATRLRRIRLRLSKEINNQL